MYKIKISGALVFLLIMLIQNACMESSIISTTKNDKHIKVATWNEDNVKPYKLTLFDQNRFMYSMTFHSAKRNYYEKFLTGNYTFNFDTVFLKFDRKDPYNNIRPYLLRETSGSYLIQDFTDSTPKMYFRLTNRRGHHTYKL